MHPCTRYQKVSLSQGIKGQEKKGGVNEWEREDVRNSSENIAFLLLIMRNTNSRWYNCITKLHPSCAKGRWTNRRRHKTIHKIYDSKFPVSLSSDLLYHTHTHMHAVYITWSTNKDIAVSLKQIFYQILLTFKYKFVPKNYKHANLCVCMLVIFVKCMSREKCPYTVIFINKAFI